MGDDFGEILKENVGKYPSLTPFPGLATATVTLFELECLNVTASPGISRTIFIQPHFWLFQGTFDAELGPWGVCRSTAPTELLNARPRRGRRTDRSAARHSVVATVAAVAAVAVAVRGGTEARGQGGREVHRAWCGWKILQYFQS